MSEIYQNRHRALFHFFYRLTGKQATSEDLVHEVFLRMIRYRHTYREEQADGGFESWMYRIARNALTDHARKRRHETDAGEDELETIDERAPHAFRDHGEAAGSRPPPPRIGELPDDKRELLVLARFHDSRTIRSARFSAVNQAPSRARLPRHETAGRCLFGFTQGESIMMCNQAKELIGSLACMRRPSTDAEITAFELHVETCGSECGAELAAAGRPAGAPRRSPCARTRARRFINDGKRRSNPLSQNRQSRNGPSRNFVPNQRLFREPRSFADFWPSTPGMAGRNRACLLTCSAFLPGLANISPAPEQRNRETP